VAYAHIPATGGVDSAKNVAPGNVTNPGTGLYCVGGLGVTVHVAVASAGFSGAAHSAIAGLGTQGSCPGGTQITIVTFDTMGNPTQNDINLEIN
jgi:hypothetical protein